MYLMVSPDGQAVCPVCRTASRVKRRIKSYFVPEMSQYHNNYVNGVSNQYNHGYSNGYSSQYDDGYAYGISSQYDNGYANGISSYSYEDPFQPLQTPPQVLAPSMYNSSYRPTHMPPFRPHGNGYHQQPLPSPQAHQRRRAVLCGVTYKSHKQPLDASINNVRHMQRFLVGKVGFPEASVLVLTEEEVDPSRIPTKHNIQIALQWLIKDCQSGDSLVFYYTGHATQIRDDDGDELDGYDEALCPVDYKTAGKILDDEINATIITPLPHGAKLHAIIDTCFSGTLLDLPYLCRMDSNGCYHWEDHHLSHATAFKKTRGGIALCFSACDDHQNSGDTTAFTGNAIGALTYSFIHAVENERKLTYGHMLTAMRNKVSEARRVLGINAPFASSKSQEPQLTSSKDFNIYSEHFML